MSVDRLDSYAYIPKKTAWFDLDTYDGTLTEVTLRLYKGWLSTIDDSTCLADGLCRDIDITPAKTHIIQLQTGEAGTIARVRQEGFAFPYLHSVPRLWAMSPNNLMVPRAIAIADKLTILS